MVVKIAGIIVAVIFALSVFWYAYEPDVFEFTPREIKFETLAQNKNSGVTEPGNYVLNNGKDFVDVWEQTFSDTSLVDPPLIDFSSNMAIAVYLGSKPTGGYNINIEKIIEEKNSYEVFVLVEEPGEGCIVSQAFTEPYHIVEVPLTDKKVNFNTEIISEDCLL